jgi:phage terminase large subunit
LRRRVGLFLPNPGDLDDGDILTVTAEFPPTLVGPLTAISRYLILYGGRGGGKSWSVARYLLMKAVQDPIRVLCVREFMSSISDSVHKLLSDQILELGLSSRFVIEKGGIYGVNGSEFRFAGIRNNPSAIRSFEGIDVCFCEEASNISKGSWNLLIPTIRKKGSRIIVAFNPELESDDTYQRFIVNNAPDSIVVKINFDENPFLHGAQKSILLDEAEYMKANDPDLYQNVYLGFPKIYLDHAIYAKELRRATEENRIKDVPYDNLAPVHTFWDLGWRDQTAIIFAQYIGFEYRIIDYMQESQMTITEYVKLLQKKPYVYGTDFLPHDARAKQMGSGRSIEEIMRSNGRTVQIVQKLSVTDGINATRTMLEKTWIDKTKCFDLIQCLRKYRYDLGKMDPDGSFKNIPPNPQPLHDESSHGADALRAMAIGLRPPKDVFRSRNAVITQRANGWMG